MKPRRPPAHARTHRSLNVVLAGALASTSLATGLLLAPSIFQPARAAGAAVGQLSIGRLTGQLLTADPLAGARLSGAAPGSTRPAGPLTPLTPTAGWTGATEPAVTTADPGPGVTVAAVAMALTGHITDSRLGRSVGSVVVDVSSGAVLWNRNGAEPRTPASTMKLLTMAGALSAAGAGAPAPTTRVLLLASGTLLLVGGGDATLASFARPGYPAPAALAALAAGTVTGLGARVAPAGGWRVAFDDGLFSGPALATGWPASYLRDGIVATPDALMLDQGHTQPRADPETPTGAARVPDPAAAAAKAFTALLAAHGVRVAGVPGRSATSLRVNAMLGTAPLPAGAVVLAELPGPPVPAVASRALTSSDNDLAEALLRWAGVVGSSSGGATSAATGSVGTGAAAVASALTALGLPLTGLVQVDGSGLSRTDKVTPLLLADLLRQAVVGPAWLRPLLDGLPIAGLTGTLSDRFTATSALAGRGVVRAKTGTLTAVTTLAGVVVTRSGKVLAFAVQADQVQDTTAARGAIDAIAAALAAID